MQQDTLVWKLYISLTSVIDIISLYGWRAENSNGTSIFQDGFMRVITLAIVTAVSPN